MSIWWHTRRGSKSTVSSISVSLWLVMVLIGFVAAMIAFALAR